MEGTRFRSSAMVLAVLLGLGVGLSVAQGPGPEGNAGATAQPAELPNTLDGTDATEWLRFRGLSSPPAPPAIQASTAGNWHIECVDCPRYFRGMTDRSLRLDADDHPHIAYGGKHLYYAWHDGTQWHYETVDDAPRVGQYASLALDGSGRPHISYYDDTNHDLKYAWHDGVDWRIETVDSEGWVGYYTSLALDGSGRPHISYFAGFDNYDLKYAWHDGVDWRIETVDSEGWVGEYTSLALDGSGRPHISYAHLTNGLKYAWHDGTAWHIQTVDSEGSVGRYTSLALDGAGRPHISYYDGHPNYDVKYAWHDGTTWHIQTVDSEGSVGWYTSLALDGSGRPHISYCLYDPGNYICDDLKYAWHDGADWRIETVDSEGWVGYYTSLALDGSDRPHVTYWDTGNYDLKFTSYDGMAWHIETVDSDWDEEKTECGETSLALDGLGRPYISYSRAGDLKYVWHDGAAWQIETVDMGWYKEDEDEMKWCGDSSLALDGSGRPHISYYVWWDFGPGAWAADLHYAWHDGTAWHIETVDSAGLDGLDTSLALDGAGRPHISYYVGYPHSDLRYAWYDGAAWDVETVDSGGNPSLALDGAGRPHISYYDPTNGDLKYAWYDGVGWQIETVDSTGDVGEYTSLALDGSGRPQISFCDHSSGELKYARLMPSPHLTKQAAPADGLRNNETLTYTLTLSAPGLSVLLWDSIPANVHYITGSVTPPAVYSPTVRAVVWQGTLPTDTVQVIRFQATPGITGTEALSLSLPIVNTAWVTDTESGRSVSATVIVNGWRFYLPLIPQ
jgi:hypothetical protein